MYLLFRYHHILPSTYYSAGIGEQKVLAAFMHFQLEKMREEIEEAKLNEQNH